MFMAMGTASETDASGLGVQPAHPLRDGRGSLGGEWGAADRNPAKKNKTRSMAGLVSTKRSADRDNRLVLRLAHLGRNCQGSADRGCRKLLSYMDLQSDRVGGMTPLGLDLTGVHSLVKSRIQSGQGRPKTLPVQGARIPSNLTRCRCIVRADETQGSNP